MNPSPAQESAKADSYSFTDQFKPVPSGQGDQS